MIARWLNLWSTAFLPRYHGWIVWNDQKNPPMPSARTPKPQSSCLGMALIGLLVEFKHSGFHYVFKRETETVAWIWSLKHSYPPCKPYWLPSSPGKLLVNIMVLYHSKTEWTHMKCKSWDYQTWRMLPASPTIKEKGRVHVKPVTSNFEYRWKPSSKAWLQGFRRLQKEVDYDLNFSKLASKIEMIATRRWCWCIGFGLSWTLAGLLSINLWRCTHLWRLLRHVLTRKSYST